MKALVFDGKLRIKEEPIPSPNPGEALVRLLAAGICRTDLEIRNGYMNFNGILGHEFVGIVEKCSTPCLRGKRVVGEINCICGACKYCAMEMPRHCENRTVLGIYNRNGAFAEYLTLPEKNLYPVPNTLRDDVALFAEPLAAAFRIPEQIAITDHDRVIVLGDGKLGQLVAQVLSFHTKNLVCVGRHPWKLSFMEQRGIQTETSDMGVDSGADIVVDATGHPDGLRRAIALARPEGTVVMKTTCSGDTTLSTSVAVVNEIRLIGSRCGPFKPALEALVLGTVDVSNLISEVFPLTEGIKALTRAGDPGVMKVLLHM